MEDYIISIVLTCFAFAVVYFGIKYYFTTPNQDSSQVLVSTVQDGKTESSGTGIKPSTNQKGLEFSYVGWVFVDDFTYRYGEKKVIFTKGTPDLKIACPALVLDANTNSFLVYVDTYGTQEIVPVANITSKKWMHFAICVDQVSVDIYINGVLYTHHTMNQIPKQNESSLLISPGGGFQGKVGGLNYYPKLLNPSDVATLSVNPPKLGEETLGTLPPYFATRWWVKNE
jgi:hypothetical protein